MKRFISAVFLLGLSGISLAAAEISPAIAPLDSTTSATEPRSFFDRLRAKRITWSDKGYDWQFIYKLDLIRKISKPNQENFGLDNLDIKLLLNGEKVFGIKGSSGLLYVLSNHGSKPALRSDRIPHGLDNIETPYNANTTKLYQAWIQREFFDSRLSVLAGLYDLNSEFYVNELAGIFLHPTFGIGAELAGTGLNGPSIFPTTSFAVRVKAQPVPGYFIQAVTLDAVPGDLNNAHGTHVQFNKGEGALNVVEGEIPLGMSDDLHDNKITLGVWRYTARFDDVLDVDGSNNPLQRLSHGVYSTVEKVFMHDPVTHEESLRGFLRMGKTEGDTSQFDRAWSTGLVFEGLLLGREHDVFGVAYAQERNSAKWRSASGNATPYEKSFEVGYRYIVTPHIVLQPFAQYLLDHSNDPTQNKSWWLGTRLEANF
jgi:porin